MNMEKSNHGVNEKKMWEKQTQIAKDSIWNRAVLPYKPKLMGNITQNHLQQSMCFVEFQTFDN